MKIAINLKPSLRPEAAHTLRRGETRFFTSRSTLAGWVGAWQVNDSRLELTRFASMRAMIARLETNRITEAFTISSVAPVTRISLEVAASSVAWHSSGFAQSGLSGVANVALLG